MIGAVKNTSVLLLLLLLLCMCSGGGSSSGLNTDAHAHAHAPAPAHLPSPPSSPSSFTEKLLIRPLTRDAMYVHFEFEMASSSRSPSADPFASPSYVLFPKSIGQVVDRYGVEVSRTMMRCVWCVREYK